MIFQLTLLCLRSVRHGFAHAVFGTLLLCMSPNLGATTSATERSVSDAGMTEQQVMQSFTANPDTANSSSSSDKSRVEDRQKRLVMFMLGVPLLLLLLVTGGLGVAMGIYGKPVFVAHMLCAGLSMTLALAHAVVGIVWFYPF